MVLVLVPIEGERSKIVLVPIEEEHTEDIMEPEAFGYCWHRNNGEFYYGIHRGTIDDGYIGSGTLFRKKFNNTPKEEWERTIEFRGTSKECEQWEAEVVNKDLIETDLCLNLKTGGNELIQPSEESKAKMRKAHLGKTIPEEVREKISDSRAGQILSQQTKEKISNTRRANGIGRGKNHFNWGRTTYKLTDPEGNVIIISGGWKQFCKNNGLRRDYMRNVALGKQKHHKGWTCKIIEGGKYAW